MIGDEIPFAGSRSVIQSPRIRDRERKILGRLLAEVCIHGPVSQKLLKKTGMMPSLRKWRIGIKLLHHVADDELIQVNDLLAEFGEWKSFVEPTVDAAPRILMVSDH
jgi:hypothetical protein